MIHFFFGSNQYQIKTALDELVRSTKSKHGEHAVERVEGETLELRQLPDILQGATLFAPQRLVIVKGLSKNKPAWDALGDKLEQIPSSLQLVIVETAPDKRTRTFKQLQKLADVHEAKELAEPEAAKWLTDEAARRGGKLETAMAKKIVERAGTDQWRLSNELDKLLLHSQVSDSLISELVEMTPQANVFALLDAVMQGRTDAVREMLHEAKAIEDPYMLFGLLTAQVMQLAALVHGRGRSSAEIAKLLKVHPYPLGKLSSIANKLDRSQLRSMVEAVAGMDDDVKSSGVDPWVLLERTLIKIAAR